MVVWAEGLQRRGEVVSQEAVIRASGTQQGGTRGQPGTDDGIACSEKKKTLGTFASKKMDFMYCFLLLPLNTTKTPG